MEFGLSLPHFRPIASPDNIRRVAQRAEELGFDSLWVTDHVLLPESAVPTFGPDFYEPLTVLAYTAAVTSRIRIGSSVIVLPYRPPILAAKMLATIDVLSGGRLDVGVGSGGVADEFEALGIPFEGRGVWVDEALQLMKELWTNPTPSFEGRYFKVANVSSRPLPVQKPHPPIWVGGNSKRGMRRAVEHGSVWCPSGQEPAWIAEGVTQLRQLAASRGRNPAEIAIAARVGHKILSQPNPAGPRVLIGTRDQILEQISRYQQAGVGHFVVDLFYRAAEIQDSTIDEVLAAMTRLAEEIRPQVAPGPA